jgi:hypothetical protein
MVGEHNFRTVFLGESSKNSAVQAGRANRRVKYLPLSFAGAFLPQHLKARPDFPYPRGHGRCFTGRAFTSCGSASC